MATEKMGAYKKKGAAESKELSEKGPVDGRDETMNKEGSDTMGPGRGSKKGDQSATKLDYEGPGRSMGYTQNFGPARVNGYSKGAAKVNSIMGRGAAQKQKSPSLGDLSAFALKTGDKVTENNNNAAMLKERNAAIGQFQDSLNLTSNDDPSKAKRLYGEELAFGDTVAANSSKFTDEDKTRQKEAVSQFMSNYRRSQPEG